MDYAGNELKIDETMIGWNKLFSVIQQKFPGFNTDNFHKVEKSFPNESSLLCWMSENADLGVN